MGASASWSLIIEEVAQLGGKEADSSIDYHPKKATPEPVECWAKWPALDLMPFPGLAPFLIPNCPETDKSRLFLGDHRGALLLVSHCSCLDTSSFAPGEVANAFRHPDLHAQLLDASAAPFGQLVHGSPFPLPQRPLFLQLTLHLDPPSPY